MRGSYYRHSSSALNHARHFALNAEYAFCPNCNKVFRRGADSNCPTCVRAGLSSVVCWSESIPEHIKNQIKNLDINKE